MTEFIYYRTSLTTSITLHTRNFSRELLGKARVSLNSVLYSKRSSQDTNVRAPIARRTFDVLKINSLYYSASSDRSKEQIFMTSHV